MATTGSRSWFEIESVVLPSPPTVMLFPVHDPFSRFPEMMSQYVPAGREVCVMYVANIEIRVHIGTYFLKDFFQK
jgi:hypothetical protein